MGSKVVAVIVLLLFSVSVCNGCCSDNTESENHLCECTQSMNELVEFVKELDKRLSIVSKQVMELIALRNSFNAAQRKNDVQHKEMRNLINKLTRERHSSNDGPSSEALVLEPETVAEATTSSPSTMADEAAKMENLTTLIREVNGKFKEVESLTTEVTELRQENKAFKEEIEKEKRVRRYLQEKLNETQTLVVEIKEMVNEKDSENSTIDEVSEIVFAKLSEFHMLNKTAIENQLKKLEYTVNDVFKNETQLVRRLDSVENASAYTAGLLENGTLVDKVHNIAGTVEILEKLQFEQSNAISQLEQTMDNVNATLKRELKELEYAMLFMDVSTNKTLFSFASEISEINHTWNNKSVAIDEAFSAITEKITELGSTVGNATNITANVEAHLKSVLSEVLYNISVSQKEINDAQLILHELKQLPDELTYVQSVLNHTVKKEELHELEKNVTEQNRLLQEKTFAFFSDVSGTINHTVQKINRLESKNAAENFQIREHLNESAAQQQHIREQTEDFTMELQNLKWNVSVTFNILESQVENLLLKVEESDQQHLSIASVVRDHVSELRNLQLKYANMTTTIHAYKEETLYLIEKLEAAINSTRQTEENLGRLRIGGEDTPGEGEETAPCLYFDDAIDGELVVAYRPHSVYEELSGDDSIPHGEQIFFSCKEIGKVILVGRDTLTCINGQWNNDFPRCEKLLDEGVIRGAIHISTDPCLKPRGQFPHPSDCMQYFDCWDGQRVERKCQNGLHFNANSERCDYPGSANCTLQNQKEKLQHLVNIVPPVDFSPLKLNSVNSRLAASITGVVVVYPGTTLSLLCLYPRQLGEPQWETQEMASHPHISAWDISSTDELKDAYKLKLTIAAATEDDSGNFTCVSPTGQRHTIRVSVKDVKCSAFDVDQSSALSISYTPHSEDVQKIMTTQASFGCSCGYQLNGSSTAICKASGTWSHSLPTCVREDIEGCLKPDLHGRPGLFVYPEKCTYSVGEKVFFKCRSQITPKGPTTARCTEDGIWTVAYGLPYCG